MSGRQSPKQVVGVDECAVVSILTGMEDGSAVEIATIGNEGMVGAPIVIGARETVPRGITPVQVPGTVIRIDADRFREQSNDGALRDVAGRYLQAFLAQASQQVACNGLHSVEELCSRWSRLSHDCVPARCPCTGLITSSLPRWTFSRRCWAYDGHR